jgi:small subunit ribosomal protein S4
MARNLDSKCRKCRRANEKLFLKGDRCFSPKCAMIRKPYAPGVHGKKYSRTLSEYGRQLAMKQRIKRIYGIMEKQFRKHYEEIENKQGVAGDLLMARLEMRLDNVVYQMGFASSRSLARQLVSHGALQVNGKKVDIPSFYVKINDIISIKESKKSNEYFKNQIGVLKNKKNFPTWVSFDNSKLEGRVVSVPTREQIGVNVDPELVIEYYSR